MKWVVSKICLCKHKAYNNKWIWSLVYYKEIKLALVLWIIVIILTFLKEKYSIANNNYNIQEINNLSS
jgi:hypothetical protein